MSPKSPDPRPSSLPEGLRGGEGVPGIAEAHSARADVATCETVIGGEAYSLGRGPAPQGSPRVQGHSPGCLSWSRAHPPALTPVSSLAGCLPLSSEPLSSSWGQGPECGAGLRPLAPPILGTPPTCPRSWPLTCEEDVVELVLQQLPRLLGPAQHHGKAALQGGGRDARLRGPCRISHWWEWGLSLTWSRYRGSTLARTFSVFLLISEGFSTTQLPAGRGGARRGRGHV